MLPLVIAHRGASAAFPEHTRAALRHAIAVGADGLECDVQLTRDREVVLWHDATLERTSDGRGALADRPLRLAVELKHPSPFGRELEEKVLRELVAAGWGPGPVTWGR